MLDELEGPADIGQLVQGLEMENLFFLVLTGMVLPTSQI